MKFACLWVIRVDFLVLSISTHIFETMFGSEKVEAHSLRFEWLIHHKPMVETLLGIFYERKKGGKIDGEHFECLRQL